MIQSELNYFNQEKKKLFFHYQIKIMIFYFFIHLMNIKNIIFTHFNEIILYFKVIKINKLNFNIPKLYNNFFYHNPNQHQKL